ncbi:MAG: succinate dehydrogenase assembly factor 2 [Sutterellaceae bacterium]|nr:succinate dehydrogenase assembly factor 2 [Burkholderiaceae bacterium]MDW8429903.1 succinate dehydrogenase assembly factor 2 [Sutterellaceae bacterium]
MECALSELELKRLHWRARRGMLENDLILSRFLNAHGARLKAAEAAALARLLELPDHELLDLLLGRKEPSGDLATSDIIALLAQLRAA